MQVEIERTFKASKEQLYKFWTSPELVSEWMGVTVECDPKVGGNLLFDFKEECGPTTGEYTIMNPHDKVAFTWCSTYGGDSKPEGFEPVGDTLVTITLSEVSPSETKMHLLHTGFKFESVRKDHEEGWNEYYDAWEKKLV